MEPAAPLACVIIDDNEINRFTLERAVQRHDQLTLAASFPDALEALTYFHAGGEVDVLLLDIEMPHINGLELVKLLPEPKPAVILVTTHASFAVDAFELHVLDYLVKPVNYARFCQAIARVSVPKPPVAPAPAPAISTPVAPNDLSATGTDLFVKTNGKLLRINFEDVLFIEALSTYVVLVTDKYKHIVGGTLKSMEERLPFRHFVRVHRSYIVNLHRVEALEDNLLKLGQHEVPVSRPYQDELIQRLQAL
ncbi:LytTR family DNA-binding domain-containing protein (plasmid) [Hymenobacter tibetensis]|uniref:LytTR family DNA-binding domain-containing protein n=1 Tax=Hymenobacter tibetensis TaxID=497967 RepID=A0ABY4D5Z8_9BACT|nr:LytTR family DNA-binding domain-containing protein [Hymenobacter tibetensis]UOG77597.1 LytTR family DNA-binding domain-containing protein [Hymenobacter tibetensis]